MYDLLKFITSQGFNFSLPEGKIPYQERSLEKYKVYEPETEAAIYRFVKPGMQIIECGACCGYHALNLAKAVGSTGKVFCFEANPELIPILKQNIEVNGFKERVLIFNKGIWDKNDVVPFPVQNEALGMASIPRLQKRIRHNNPIFRKLLEWKSSDLKKIIQLEVVSLDEYFKNQKIDFIRMDIEGAELRALKGAKKLLNKHNITIIMEWAFQQGRTDKETIELFDLLRSLNYKVYRILSEELVKMETVEEFMISLANKSLRNQRDILCTKEEMEE